MTRTERRQHSTAATAALLAEFYGTDPSATELGDALVGALDQLADDAHHHNHAAQRILTPEYP
ncbi:hypothetical protein P3T37_001308 [Kitasatospora sp. MAA4]|uniref:hypothetical protein n=1 Tax=Kitasatospora sp. MAA4 TaxID=3035093 RepID=UPI002474D007|nr:hypothetical protein [Kitasatospora sp. MAA4]MDH6131934.1 hypothetical protein [Kitasatospora sp. MAA4]